MKARRVARILSGMGVVVMSILGVTTCHVAQTKAQTVREVAVPGMGGIASVGYRGNNLTIEYNPRTCARLGPELCSFFRAHEYGHIALNHLQRGTPVRQAEHEADVWAARNTTPAARAAAVNYFSAGNGGSFKHGSPAARAARVSSAATSTAVRVTRRPDGSRVVNRGYSASVARPFNTGRVLTLLQWRGR